jgi:hypothetical protein
MCIIPIQALAPLVESGTAEEKHRIKLFLLQFSGSNVDRKFLDKLANHPSLNALLAEKELATLRASADDGEELPTLLTQTDWPIDKAIIERKIYCGNVGNVLR